MHQPQAGVLGPQNLDECRGPRGKQRHCAGFWRKLSKGWGFMRDGAGELAFPLSLAPSIREQLQGALPLPQRRSVGTWGTKEMAATVRPRGVSKAQWLGPTYLAQV